MELFMKHPQELQNNLLMDMIRFARHTEVGKKYGFADMKSYRDFADRVPLGNYNDVQDDIERCKNGENNILWPTPIKWFA
ncbi:putative auxin-regulated protein [Nonlabens ulvanivorans]|nr:putative auxin-regulated protein [Nonlabens ulvanivorans]